MDLIFSIIGKTLIISLVIYCSLGKCSSISYPGSRDEESQPVTIKSLSKISTLQDSLKYDNHEDSGSNLYRQYSSVFDHGVGKNDSTNSPGIKVIFLCGGSGNRFNYNFPESAEDRYSIPHGVPPKKQFIHIYNVPLFIYSLAFFLNNPLVSQTVIVAKEEWFSDIVKMILRSRGFIANYGQKFELPLGGGGPEGSVMGLKTLVYDSELKDFINITPSSASNSLNDDSARGNDSFLKKNAGTHYDNTANSTPNTANTGKNGTQNRDVNKNRGNIGTNIRYKRITFSNSGLERCHSVLSGLKSLEKSSQNDDIVLIHDSARPFVNLLNLKNLVETANKFGAAVPGYRVVDTVKLVSSKKVLKTLERSKTFIIQTPQAFKFNLIKTAYENVMDELEFEPKLLEFMTDDSSFLESQFVNVRVTEGHRLNMKLSVNEDLDLCSMLIKQFYFT